MFHEEKKLGYLKNENESGMLMGVNGVIEV